MKLACDGYGRQPMRGQLVGEAVALLGDSGDVGRRQLGPRAATAVARAAETVPTEAGARNETIGARVSGRAIAKPTRMPGQGVGLAQRPDHDEPGVVGPKRQHGAAGELRVGLVDGTTGAVAAVAQRASTPGRSSSSPIRSGGSQVPVGLFGSHSQTSWAPRAASASAGMSSPKPSSRAEPRARPRHARAALLRDDPVHRVGRHGHDGHGTLSQEGPSGQVQRLVGAGRRAAARPAPRRTTAAAAATSAA